MKVIYDFQILLMQQYGGISRYFYELVSRMKMNQVEVKIPVIGNLNYYFENVLNQPVREWDRKYYRQMWKLNCYYNNHVIKRSSDAIIHPTAYNPYFMDNVNGKMVITIHDMIHERFPQYYAGNPTIEHKKILMEKSDAIVAVSQATKDDILNVYPYISEDKIHVIHHGCSENILCEQIPSQSYIEKHQDYGKYVLYVGNRDRYKNFMLFAKAFADIMAEKKELSLLCVGGGTINQEEQAIFDYRGVGNRVFQERSTDIELNWLYSHAQCLVFPSLSEGFGIPILEAFSRGCPVVLSDIPCFKEVAGDAAVYFDPKNERDISEKIYMALEERCRNSLISLGKKRVGSFSWDKTAQEHQSLYLQILEY